MALKFGLVFLLSFLLAFMMQTIAIHQFAINSILYNFMADLGDPSSAASQFKADAVTLLTGVHRTFGHGALHGAIAGGFFAIPIFGINALFERKNFKYIAIHAGYWIITLALMGGVICQFAPPVLK